MLTLLPIALLLQSMPPPEAACYQRKSTNGVEVLAYIGDRACVKLDEPRVFEGIWIDAFEGSEYFDGAKTLQDIRDVKATVWLSSDAQTKPLPKATKLRGPSYRVRFIGRSASDMSRKPLSGYGHFGMYPGLVLVDEWLEIAAPDAR